ncbi:MAG: endonuclease V, partial [Actinomycetota bacterium]|nr:endonuclease V [Actinomycetota bacterium]
MWPATEAALVEEQRTLAAAPAPRWQPAEGPLHLGGCWVCFPRGLSGPGEAGDPAWAAAVTLRSGRQTGRYVETGVAAAAYVPGLMALRAGGLLESVVRGLPGRPDVLLLDATGRD